MSYDYLDYDLSDNEWENSDSGDFDDSLSSGSEDSEDFSSRLASFGLEDIDDLVRLQVLPVITYWVEKTNPRTQQVYQDLIEEEPHEQLLIEIKNKIPLRFQRVFTGFYGVSVQSILQCDAHFFPPIFHYFLLKYINLLW
jgi:hypothetical protein